MPILTSLDHNTHSFERIPQVRDYLIHMPVADDLIEQQHGIAHFVFLCPFTPHAIDDHLAPLFQLFAHGQPP